MSVLVLPAWHRSALALREPNLLVPGKKPVGPVEINWNNPLTRGLTGLWFFSERDYRNLVTGRAAESVVGTSIEYDADGSYALSATAGHLIRTDITNTAEMSIVFSIEAGALTNTNMVLCGAIDGTGPFELVLNNSRELWWASTLDWNINLTGDTIALNSKHDFCFVSDAANGTSVYLDGVLTDTSAATGNLGISTNNISFFDRGDVWAGGPGKGKFYWAAVWNRPISSTEYAESRRNITQLVKSSNQTPYLVGVPAGGGAPTLSDISAESITSTSVTPRITVTF